MIPIVGRVFNVLNHSNISNFLILLKLKAIFKILQKYIEITMGLKNLLIPNMIKIFRLFIGILFSAHVIALIFLFIAY